MQCIMGLSRKQNKHNLPVHVTPFPVYPVLQEQVKDPCVLLHVASE